MADLKSWSQDEIVRMRREMDRLFDDLCTDFDLPSMVCRMTGDLELREEGGTLIVHMEMGNMNPEDVNVTVHERDLIISTHSVEVSEGRRETRTFRKEVKLPCIIRPDKVVAEFDDGILEVRLPKCPTQSGQQIQIKKK
tara:strand:- start:1030 stop:1446 length:417 start_codon:yes stop_codon:yes gene_type:complete